MNEIRPRYLSVAFVFGTLAVLWAAYLFNIQVFDPFDLSELSRTRYTPGKEILIPTRGAIFDINGNLLVSSLSLYQIDIDRSAIAKWVKKKGINLADAYQKVAEIIATNSSLGSEAVMQRLQSNNRLNCIQISNRIKEMELDGIIKTFDAEGIPGLVYAFSSMRRIYSKELLAARLLGSVREQCDGLDQMGMDQSMYKLSGICGIEATHDKALSGEYGWREVIYDAYRDRVPYPDLRQKPAQNGYNVWLTIDSDIQEIVENALLSGLETYGACNASAVVMDPNTGRIIAMAGISRDDKGADPGIVRTRPNIPVSFMFEPGSVIKPISILPALEKNLVSPTEMIPCGTYQIGSRRISDVHKSSELNRKDILVHSSNVGVARIAERIGQQRFYENYISFGFGQKTGINLYGETSGIFRKLENWGKTSIHSLSFGQEISVTTIQLAVAFSALANGGKLMKPYIVDSYRDENGNVMEQFEPVLLRSVSNPATIDTIKVYLQAVVEKGTGRNANVGYINVAGKTSTAQKKAEGSPGYAQGKYTAVFTGFFPVEKPELVISIIYDEPQGVYHYGSMSSAPTFKTIMENILFMPGCTILPYNQRLIQTSLTMPNLIGQPLYKAESILNQYGFLYHIVGPDSASVVVDQFPKPNVTIDRNHHITLKIGKSVDQNLPRITQGVMPDLRGLTLRKAIQLAAQHHICLNISGSGKVRKQSILPGSRVLPGATCQVEATL